MATKLRAHGRGVAVPTSVKKNAKVCLKVCSKCPNGCVEYRLQKSPRRIAYAKGGGFEPVVALTNHDDIIRGQLLEFGQDALHSPGRSAPKGESVENWGNEFHDEYHLEQDVRGLAKFFAKDDKTGMSRRLIEAFLRRERPDRPDQLRIWSDQAYDDAVAKHQNMLDFMDLTMGHPSLKAVQDQKAPMSQVRVHQALQLAGWDVNRAKVVDDLGAPAFNRGGIEVGGERFEHKLVKILWKTEDYSNGLLLMVDGIQHVLVDVESYEYVSCKQEYTIDLRFAIFDVFGLDDADLTKGIALGFEFGAQNRLRTSPQIGFTAWWQLQHQYDYPPLITRAVVQRSYTFPTRGE